ncbi:apoptosis inhibitor 5-like protein API5 isoform X2 [Macadamia integrifolia]|uniref:apoptosis inhibitor 5-like protein API5 isoform X2 n=1 Tax=Macadamia integrifolia TaxID=60698 RepID=UPI001C4E7407|nr:apoptosis inhibitor 5-like protein API5 isoform X2 [Macadamia integrifolia]
MVDGSEDTSDVEKLYEYGERLNEAKDKSQNVEDYEGIIRAAKGSIKAKQLAAQLIPRFFKFFPSISSQAVEAHFDLCEEEELGVSCNHDINHLTAIVMQILHKNRLVLLGISLGLGCICVGPSVHVVWSVMGRFYGSKLGVLRL